VTTTISNSLVGLSLLTGANGFASLGGTQKIESAAVRLAKAGFTLAPTTPPWKDQKAATTTDSAQLAAIKRLTSIIDKASGGIGALPDDVQTSFTAYKALDRLRVLAQTAAAAMTGSAERTKLDALFKQGLADLQSYLGQAPSDKLDLAFGIPTRRADTVGVPARSQFEVKGEGVLAQRTDPIPGMTGTEQFTITLNKPNSTTNDTVQVDLSSTPQPPTLDSVADAINAAISAIPLRNPDGSLHIDPVTGQTSPKWLAHFVPDKSTDKWASRTRTPPRSRCRKQRIMRQTRSWSRRGRPHWMRRSGCSCSASMIPPMAAHNTAMARLRGSTGLVRNWQSSPRPRPLRRRA
jgi:hypothetical protein